MQYTHSTAHLYTSQVLPILPHREGGMEEPLKLLPDGGNQFGHLHRLEPGEEASVGIQSWLTVGFHNYTVHSSCRLDDTSHSTLSHKYGFTYTRSA